MYVSMARSTICMRGIGADLNFGIKSDNKHKKSGTGLARAWRQKSRLGCAVSACAADRTKSPARCLGRVGVSRIHAAGSACGGATIGAAGLHRGHRCAAVSWAVRTRIARCTTDAGAASAGISDNSPASCKSGWRGCWCAACDGGLLHG